MNWGDSRITSVHLKLFEEIKHMSLLEILLEKSDAMERFEINFMCDRDDGIAFHFNPRFAESHIVCNSFTSNRWGQEERCSAFPFEAEEPFQIEIYSDNESFHVYIDEEKIMQYKHRVEDLKTITKVQVANDVNISSLEITKKPFY